jgi:hypothetical protein
VISIQWIELPFSILGAIFLVGIVGIAVDKAKSK